jgi:hypothetical protein
VKSGINLNMDDGWGDLIEQATRYKIVNVDAKTNLRV